MITNEPEVLTLSPSRRIALTYVAYFLAIDAAIASFLILVAPGRGFLADLVGWVGVLFFGSSTLLFGVQFIWPSWFGLKLDAEGFTVTMNLGRRRYRWKDVDRFFLYKTLAIHPVVVFKYRGKAEVTGLQPGRGMLGIFDGSLPRNLPVRGRALQDLMEGWRVRTGQSQGRA